MLKKKERVEGWWGFGRERGGRGSLALGAGQLAKEGDGAQIVTCCLFSLADGKVTRGTKGQRPAESRRLKASAARVMGGRGRGFGF